MNNRWVRGRKVALTRAVGSISFSSTRDEYLVSVSSVADNEGVERNHKHRFFARQDLCEKDVLFQILFRYGG